MNHINPAHCTEALVELMLGKSISYIISRKAENQNIDKSEKLGLN